MSILSSLSPAAEAGLVIGLSIVAVVGLLLLIVQLGHLFEARYQP